MPAKNDWRRQGQERYLKGVTLRFQPYKSFREGWDHDHCHFCGIKLAEESSPEALSEGYATHDLYYWVCAECFSDFRDEFGWQEDRASS